LFKVLLLSASLFLPFTAIAFDNFDECGELEAALIEQQFLLELDTPFEQKTKSHGLRVTFGNEIEDFDYPYISFVHPDFFEDTNALEAYERQYQIEDELVRSINGINISSLTSEEFYREFEKEKITLVIDVMEEEITLESNKQEFRSTPIFVNATLGEVRGISTKTNSFAAKVSEQTIWADPRIDPIGVAVMQKAPTQNTSLAENRMAGFYCVLSNEFLSSIRFPLPEVEPQNFEFGENATRSRSIIYTYSNLDCAPNDAECEQHSDGLRGQFGVSGSSLSIFELREEYYGTFYESFDLRKFPFDAHTLTAKFDLDHLQARDFYELKKDPFSIASAAKAFVDYDSVNSGWDFVDYNVWENSDFYAPLNVRVPILAVEVNVERQSSYYVLKIMLPILLVLLMSWSIFWIDIRQLESRLTIGIVCLLSLIAYNFVIDSEIPKLGYVTLMDVFILLSYLFAGFSIVATVAIRYLRDKDRFKYRSESLNNIAAYAGPTCYAGASLISGAYFLL